MKASSTPSSSPTSVGPSMQFEGKGHRYNAPSRSRFTSMLLREHTYVAFLTLTSMYYRVMGVISPSGILNQELELCSQVNWYLQGKFFVGAFPPLSGMMYTYLAHQLGYKGEQTVYYPGQILDTFPIEDLRVFSAMLGSLLVPTTYLIVRVLGHGCLAASMAAGLIIFGKSIDIQT
ncbi:predicted protein [Lichtheimia corymbifera JMRC:FSU:9682]|uniref:ArnT-like N-terminal domain-containing protein n=1 Tax=Lichtheimia corymbifera JMRC:FSU:9682 TaxID=1263082 RepID=A0A068S056_9FUNG|nr:predicted protein [Lichtheimia corymbifera JMRC:FSU:9682]